MYRTELWVDEVPKETWIIKEEKLLVKKLVSFWLAGKGALIEYLVADINGDFDTKDYVKAVTGLPRSTLRAFVSRMRKEHSLIPRPRWVWVVKKTYEVLLDIDPLFPPNFFANSYIVCPLCGHSISSIQATRHLRLAHPDVFEPVYHSVLEVLGIE